MLLLALRDEGHLVPCRADHVQLHLVAADGARVRVSSSVIGVVICASCQPAYSAVAPACQNRRSGAADWFDEADADTVKADVLAHGRVSDSEPSRLLTGPTSGCYLCAPKPVVCSRPGLTSPMLSMCVILPFSTLKTSETYIT
jgi:hypothetical protein